jgi:hypothetical protein
MIVAIRLSLPVRSGKLGNADDRGNSESHKSERPILAQIKFLALEDQPCERTYDNKDDTQPDECSRKVLSVFESEIPKEVVHSRTTSS